MKLRRLAAMEDRRISAYERKYTSIIHKAIKKQVENYIKNGFISNDIEEALNDLYSTVMPDYLKRQWDILEKNNVTKSEFFVDSWKKWVTDYIIMNLRSRAANIDDTTKKWIRDAERAGAEDIPELLVGDLSFGENRMAIAEHLRELTNGAFGFKRAKMIARTEMGEAVNIAKTKSSDDWSLNTGMKQGKLWIHRGAKDPRSWHMALDNGQAIPKEDYWTVTNPNTGESDRMRHPHDPGSSAGNVVNCGCTIIYTRWKDGSNKY